MYANLVVEAFWPAPIWVARCRRSVLGRPSSCDSNWKRFRMSATMDIGQRRTGSLRPMHHIGYYCHKMNRHVLAPTGILDNEGVILLQRANYLFSTTSLD